MMARKRTHNETLRTLGTSTRATVDRIVRTFDRATASDIEAGASWYADAGLLAAELAPFTHAGTVEHAAAVIAALSPRTTWTRNVAGATALLVDGKRLPGIIGRNFRTACEATRDGVAALNGPKTRRFAANIAGDRDAVTVDVWAARVAFGSRIAEPESALSRVGVYDAVEHAYRLAAARRGVDPTTMQATTWIVARNGRAS